MKSKENIKAVEELLIEIKNTDRESYEQKSDELFASICSAINISSPTPMEILFDRKNDTTKRNFVAVCLLRLLCYCPDIIWTNRNLRIKTFSLFDQQFQNNIYKFFKISDGDDNHIKLSKLRGIEELIINNFDRINKSIVSIETAIKIRNSYMNEINGIGNRPFINNFIDTAIISNERIGELFDAISEYKESDIVNRLESFQKIEKIFLLFVNDAEANKYSFYTDKFIIDTFNKIYDLIKQDFEKNDLIKPTRLILSKLERKYPFHILEKVLELKFEIENIGPGFAFDVQTEITDIDKETYIQNPLVYSGTLEPYKKYEISFQARINSNIQGKLNLICRLTWKHFNLATQSTDFIFELDEQRTDINWESLKLKQPYSLEAVENEEDLIGRREIIDAIYSKLTSPKIESSIIYGQKRVGKTSLARIIQHRLKQEQNYITIFISTGALDKTTPEKFIKTLGDNIVRKISYNPLLEILKSHLLKVPLNPSSDILRKSDI